MMDTNANHIPYVNTRYCYFDEVLWVQIEELLSTRQFTNTKQWYVCFDDKGRSLLSFINQRQDWLVNTPFKDLT